MTMELHEIVLKLIGPVQPVGETRADEERLENMRSLTDLTDKLLYEIERAAPFADREEASMKKIGAHARYFLGEVHDASQSAAQGSTK